MASSCHNGQFCAYTLKDKIKTQEMLLNYSGYAKFNSITSKLNTYTPLIPTRINKMRV